ncbi:MAG TPA: hypothetical protein VFW92_03010 [Candidatus Limnocylindrales bacterium]|nr:hypothetical protein [Candidatus Limnocylindrales bacterium]
MIDLVLLVVACAVILVGSELFTNSVEWLGHRLDIAEGAVGSVLAAIGTALPETMIPLVAIAFGGQGARTDEIGVGAILGAPFMIGTLAMCVTGLAVLLQPRRRAAGGWLAVSPRLVTRDVGTFVVAYGLAIGAALAPQGPWPVRPVVAVVLLLIYARYVWSHLSEERESSGEALPPLRLHVLDAPGRRADPLVPRLWIVLLQVVVAVAAIVGGAVLFVDLVEDVSADLGLAPVIVALVIAPIATELPENFNGVIWVRQGKDHLALGNLTGAMVFQACIPTVIALLLAPATWAVTSSSSLAFASAAIAFVSVALVFGPLVARGRLTARGMLVGGACYAAYLAIVALALPGSS